MKYQYEPAFPSHGSMGEVCYQGLTKREYFAGLAMQRMAVKDEGQFSSNERLYNDNIKHRQNVAIAAVAYANALLAELAK